jgi:hypothetical protein
MFWHSTGDKVICHKQFKTATKIHTNTLEKRMANLGLILGISIPAGVIFFIFILVAGGCFKRMGMNHEQTTQVVEGVNNAVQGFQEQMQQQMELQQQFQQ